MEANPIPTREFAMPSQDPYAEIAILRQQHLALRKLWLRWGLASYAVAIALCVAVLIRVAMIGNDPPPPMIFIVLTYVFLGFAFVTAARSLPLPRFQRR
jgi:hypothetical protein